MNRRVIIARNPLEPNTYEVHENIVDVPGFIMSQFSSWPETARVYHEVVAQTHDVTPFDPHSIARLNDLEGDIYVIVYPEGLVAMLLVALVVVVALVAVVALAQPAVPETAAESRNMQNSSPNNELSNRVNNARPNARIPDIFGQVRSTPDLLAQPYKVYENNQEVEIAYMCIGRGHYQIHDIRDGDTLLSQIPGSSAAVYGPNTSPNSGSPIYTVGAPINEPLRRVTRAEQVVGQELRPPNRQKASNPGQFKFQWPDRIYNSNGYNLSDKFNPGDGVTIAGATFTGTSGDVSTSQSARYVKTVTTERFPTSGYEMFDLGVGYLQFFNDGEPVGRGYDFEVPGNLTLYNTSWTLNFSGTYTITTAVTAGATQLRVQDDFELSLRDWHMINGWTEFFTCTIGGQSKSARFHYSGIIELASGNFDYLLGDSVVSLASNCTRTYNVNGTYTISSRSTSLDRWTLTNPELVNANWSKIRAGHTPAVNGYMIQTTSQPDDYYVEWTGDDPRNYFEPNDILVISGSSIATTLKAKTIRYPAAGSTPSTRQVDLRRAGVIQFFNDEEPVLMGLDFRANKDFELIGAKWTNYFSGIHSLLYVTSTTLRIANSDMTGDWHRINGWTAFIDCTIGGISRRARFHYDGRVELEAGNFDDLVGSSTAVFGSDCRISYDVSGIYRFSSRNATARTWQLIDVNSVDGDWAAIRDGHEPAANIVLTQVHSTDTRTLSFNGTYKIASLTADRLYLRSVDGLSGPYIVTSDWDFLDECLNRRTGFAADTFFVDNPTRAINLNGTYEIASVSMYEMILANPAAVTRDWNQLQFFTNDQIIPTNATITGNGNNWIGPFFLDKPDMTHVYCNFIAESGLWKDDGTDQFRGQVEIDILLYAANENGSAISTTIIPSQTASLTMTGSAVNRNTVAVTRKIGLVDPGRKLIYARRITAEDTAFEGQVVDEVKWKDVWMVEPETRPHFGNVTTVQTQTYATNGALAIKERKLNCLVTRKIPYISSFSGDYPQKVPVYHPDLIATKNAGQIFCAIAKDPFLGNRADSEIDFYNIINACNEVQAYFGTHSAVEFCYTFDNNSISFEEMAQSIANTAFCVAYRQGDKIKWKPELATSDSVLIFNHRNKIPDTETRTIRFASYNDHDSVQMEWVDPDDDSIETFFIPEDQSGLRTKKIDTIGIRNRTQAVWHAWRAFYKTKFNNTAVEFEATQEAALLIARDRVMVADNTRASTMDGEVWDHQALQLTLSQEVDLDPAKTYTVFLQHYDGTVEGIPCSGVDDTLNVARNSYFRNDGSVRFQTASHAGAFFEGNKVTISAASFTDPTNGSINLAGTYTVQSADASTGIVVFSDALIKNTGWARISGSGESSLRLNVGYFSERYAKRKINLAYAPAAPLSLDPNNYAKATYVIRSNDESAPAAFMVQETRPRDNFTYQVSLTNFDSRFYYMDDLKFWLNFDDLTFRDASASNHDVDEGTASGKARITYDSSRKSYTFDNTQNSSAARLTSATLVSGGGSYTKAVWVRQNGGFDGYFLSNSSYEQFRVNSSNRIIVFHNGSGGGNMVAQVFPSNDNQWHHVAVTYDAAAKICRIYLDGVLKAQRTNYPIPTAGALQPIGLGSTGVITPRCDDLRYWHRCFTDQEIADLYNGTK